MKLVVQRVSGAKVEVEGRTVGSIGPGLVVFVCIEKGDDSPLVDHYARKVVEMRIFPDEAGKMNLSVKDKGGEVFVVSQFTLAGDVEKGRRPSFDQAASPEVAEQLCREFADRIREQGVRTAEGIFGAYMQVSLVNEGPVTILLGKRKAV